jgi:protein SCO1/2
MMEFTESEFGEHVEQLPRDQLLALLHENNQLYDQRGAATVVRMRGWIMLTLSRPTLPDAALPFLLEDLDTGVDPYLVATAASALRSHPAPSAAFAPFIVRAITNIRYRDERVSLETYGAYAIGTTGTTPVRELLATLAWLGPHARAVIPEIESLHTGPTALTKKYQPTLEQILNNLQSQTESADCCQLPDSVRDLFSWLRLTRTSSSSIDSTVLEDQDGQTITFAEYFHGRPSIVVFFYTRCDNPLKCSLTITKLARIQKLLESEGLADQINTAGITYDPGFDLPERLLNYGRHRGIQFAPQHRLLRAEDGLDSLRKHFQLGVNFIESLVNRHRIELYILDAKGQTAGYFGRIQWNERDVVDRAIEVLKESDNTPRLRVASPVFGTAVALGLALFPKCPFCWAAYLSLFGIAGLESIPYSPWLQPVLAILLLLNLTSVWFRARTTGRLLPFYLVTAGALTLIASKAFSGPVAANFLGVFFTLIGSVWSTLSRSLLYSALSATIGSTRVARRAGTRQANNATTNSTIDTPVNVSGSVGETP